MVVIVVIVVVVVEVFAVVIVVIVAVAIPHLDDLFVSESPNKSLAIVLENDTIY